MGIDRFWRRKALSLLAKYQPKTILDVATGTGDLAIEAVKLNPDRIIGVDISDEMLNAGRKKIAKRKLEHKISLQKGDGEDLSFDDNTFDAITVAFGIRNFEDLEKGLNEMVRVLKRGKHLVVLEFTTPQSRWFKKIYQIYFNNILPVIGKVVSKEDKAYTYLPLSVNAFPSNEQFVRKLEYAGLKLMDHIPLTAGICAVYLCEKR